MGGRRRRDRDSLAQTVQRIPRTESQRPHGQRQGGRIQLRVGAFGRARQSDRSDHAVSAGLVIGAPVSDAALVHRGGRPALRTGRRRGQRLLASQALVQSAYGWKAQASVDDVPCEVYGRADGHDTIWVAQNAGYVVCRREIRDKTGRLIEVVRNSQLKNLAADVWIPTVQLQERYFEDPSVPGWDISKPTCVVKVVVTSVAVGHVDEKRLHIEIPNGARVHNQILDVIYQKGAGSLEFLDSGIKAGRHVMTEAAQERAPARLSTRTAVLGAVFCLLSLTSVILGHQVIRRRRCDER